MTLTYLDDRWKYAAYAGAALVVFFSVAIGLALGHYTFTKDIIPTNALALLTDDVIATGVLVAIIPVAYVASRNHGYLNSVESNIPRFLRDILQSTDSGLVLPKALIEASKVDYGPVSYEMGIAMTKFSLGYDFTASVMEAAKKLRHPYAPQMGLIISEAYSAGGRTHDVLSSSVSLFDDLEQYSEQRQSELKPYTQLVYIAVAIYLVIALIIVSQFVTPFVGIAANSSKISPGVVAPGTSLKAFNLGGIPSISYFVSVFFLSAILESVFAGMVAGKLVDGSAPVGLKHSIILVTITILAFNLPI